MTTLGQHESVAAVFDDDMDEEALLAAWAQADEDALEVLLEALPRLADTSVPLPQLQAAVARIRAGVAVARVCPCCSPGGVSGVGVTSRLIASAIVRSRSDVACW